MNAVVKWYNQEKGFGFLIYQENKQPKEIFVHYSRILGEGFKTLTPGETVQFEVGHTDKGIQAINVLRDPDFANRVYRKE